MCEESWGLLAHSMPSIVLLRVFSALYSDAAVDPIIQKCMNVCRTVDLLQADCYDKFVNLRKEVARYKDYFKEL